MKFSCNLCLNYVFHHQVFQFLNNEQAYVCYPLFPRMAEIWNSKKIRTHRFLCQKNNISQKGETLKHHFCCVITVHIFYGVSEAKHVYKRYVCKKLKYKYWMKAIRNIFQFHLRYLARFATTCSVVFEKREKYPWRSQ